jgi:hypothetical protein
MLNMKRKVIYAYVVALNSSLWLVLTGLVVFVTS